MDSSSRNVPAAQQPIGVFDSGLGGLSVLRSLRDRLPGEAFIYLGDVARLPYGTKSSEVVKKYAMGCVNFLVARGVKAVVVACNTATASALEYLQSQLPLPVFGVIDPGMEAAYRVTTHKRVLIAATPSTVRSGAYLAAFHREHPDVQVQQVACPLLVSLAEEGWFDTQITREIIEHYLQPHRSFAFDTCLLGCTHYPLLSSAFEAVLGPSIHVVHGADFLAKSVAESLASAGLLSRGPGGDGAMTFLSTDYVEKKSPIFARLFGLGSGFVTIEL